MANPLQDEPLQRSKDIEASQRLLISRAKSLKSSQAATVPPFEEKSGNEFRLSLTGSFMGSFDSRKLSSEEEGETEYKLLEIKQ